MQGFTYLEGVSTLRLDDSRCNGCGLCAQVCPHGVFSVSGGKAVVVDRDRCMECGACAMNCGAAAISVTPGVGCATAIIGSWVSGAKPSCGCG